MNIDRWSQIPGLISEVLLQVVTVGIVTAGLMAALFMASSVVVIMVAASVWLLNRIGIDMSCPEPKRNPEDNAEANHVE